MNPSVLPCFCVCGRRVEMPDDTREFVCECGRKGEVDWNAEIREQRKAAK